MTSTSRSERLRDVRRWRQVTVAGPSLRKRAETIYTVLLTCAIFGAGLFDAVHSALAQVMSVDGTATWGPALVLLGLVVTARWGAYQGPVVYAVADVAHLLGAPLNRRALAARRLAQALAAGALVGAVLGSIAVIGLAGHGRGIAAPRAVGLVGGLAAVGVIAVAAAWSVQSSDGVERSLGPLTWLALAAAVALGTLGDQHPGVLSAELWSGPWGWATAPVRASQWPLALLLLGATAVLAAAAALVRCGRCPTERHLRRAEARAGAVASLAAFDARSTRRALSRVTARGAPRATGALRWSVRRSLVLLLAWRGATALRRTPGRAAEALVLGGAGTALLLVTADRPTAALAGGLLLYVAATRLLEPMREEIDAPGRTRILLRAAWGRILFAHAVLPAALLAVIALLSVAACTATGSLAAPGGALAVTALLGVPTATLAAALSARRGGRLPTSVLSMAGADASGAGGFLVVGWLLLWPLVGAVGAGAPAALVAHNGVRALEPALILGVMITAGLAALLRRTRSP
ncbi:MAG: hypothetical protein JWO02_2765 [Solirubrobacterales bacterium]|nr:hypothetical protein [Solirubrobacterales bacterium]